MVRYRYSRWDGSQEPLGPDTGDVMDRLTDPLLSTGSLPAALRRVVLEDLPDRQGRRLEGLARLLRRLRGRRRKVLQRYGSDAVLQDLRRRLDVIVQTERAGIARRLQEVRAKLRDAEARGNADTERSLASVMERMAARNLAFLDSLPPGLAERLQALRDYEFMDDEARARFKALLDSLARMVAQRYFRDLSHGLRKLDAAALTRMKGFLRALNALLRERATGGQPNYRRFMRSYRDLLGERPPATLEDLIDQLRRSTLRMEALLDSLPADMRKEVEGALEAALQDRELAQQLRELGRHLALLRPCYGQGQGYPFTGDQPMTLEEALELVEALQKMDRLEGQLQRAQRDGDLAHVDEDLLGELLGKEAVAHFRRLRGLTARLEEDGYLMRRDGRLELTPKGLRRIGQRVLQEVFSSVTKGPAGAHPSRRTGAGLESTEETKPYTPEEPFRPHLYKSLMNAVLRQAGNLAPPLRLRPEDFESVQTEEMTRVATALVIDLSLSMVVKGSWLAAKKVALALDTLIRSRYPQDSLFIVAFSTYARQVKPRELPYLDWDQSDPYTNIQHGLALARRLLSRLAGCDKQVILISDGEPTAHLEGSRVYLQYPPSRRTLEETLREARRCGAGGITVNAFVLDGQARAAPFVEELARAGHGRLFYASPEELGRYLLVDYYARRRRVLA